MYEEYAKIRDARGLTDYDIAKRCGISQSSLSRWKNGQSSPSKRTRFKICGVLGIPPASKFVGDNGNNEFLIEGSPFKELARIRLANYIIRLSDGSVANLTNDQYDELKTSVDAFIDAWVHTHIKE